MYRFNNDDKPVRRQNSSFLKEEEQEDRNICRNEERCNDSDFRVTFTKGGGDCQYHAIARILEADPLINQSYSVRELRAIVAFRIRNASLSFIDEKRQIFIHHMNKEHKWLRNSPQAQKDSDIFRNEWARAILNGEWGNESTLQILSERFFITFLVLDNTCKTIGKTNNPNTNLVAFLHLSGEHYSNIYDLSRDKEEQYVFAKEWLCAKRFGEFSEENAEPSFR